LFEYSNQYLPLRTLQTLFLGVKNKNLSTNKPDFVLLFVMLSKVEANKKQDYHLSGSVITNTILLPTLQH
jgi:hypothetical protein